MFCEFSTDKSQIGSMSVIKGIHHLREMALTENVMRERANADRIVVGCGRYTMVSVATGSLF
jgi:cobyric acid synthase